MPDYSDLLEAARRSRLVLVKNLVAALEAEIAEKEELLSDLDTTDRVLGRTARELQFARAFILEHTGNELYDLIATEAKMTEVLGPHE